MLCGHTMYSKVPSSLGRVAVSWNEPCRPLNRRSQCGSIAQTVRRGSQATETYALHEPGRAKICKLASPVSVDEHVCGLHVAVKNLVPVQVIQSQQNLPQSAQRLPVGLIGAQCSITTCRIYLAVN